MAHVQYVDGLVREYMLFRGFTNALKVFDNELKNDKDKGFRADKIIDQITSSIATQDLQALRDIWTNLDGHLFNKLEHSLTSAVRKLEHGVLKLYLVTAHSAGKTDKITEFFMKLSAELQSQPEWKEWFYFPFCKNPEEHPSFVIYFTKHWQDTLLLSLHNFLATIFQCIPQPTLSRIDTEVNLIKKLQDENTALRNRIQNMAATPTPPTASTSGATLAPSGSSSNVAAAVGASEPHRRSRAGKVHSGNYQSLNDIIPFDIPPPSHIVDDFYIIAAETANISQMTDSQSRGLRSLIRNISSGSSPVMGRKESADRSKRRSGSVGRNWV